MPQLTWPNRSTQPRPPGLVAVFIGVLVVAYAADLLTKVWALSQLKNGHVISLIPGWLRFELIRNPGAAWSLGSSATWVFTVLAAIISAGVIWAAGRVRQRSWAAALALVLAGALGNLTDRLLRQPGPGRGHVVDFIAYRDWFIGNVADIAICLAAVWLIWLVARGVPPGGFVPGEVDQ